ncbi:hypothetical protein [Pasteuria penetrans]|uniref:hypothetical protein n=1 Tax=Pasteuria penetrans TaxID=86005 RepID=UPI000FC29CEE|nr:hypothetical protein [Pasteuria penetrans]
MTIKGTDAGESREGIFEDLVLGAQCLGEGRIRDQTRTGAARKEYRTVQKTAEQRRIRAQGSVPQKSTILIEEPEQVGVTEHTGDNQWSCFISYEKTRKNQWNICNTVGMATSISPESNGSIS